MGLRTHTGASCLADFVSWSPVSSGRFFLARGSLTSLLSSTCSSSWSISWLLQHSQYSICAWTVEQTLHYDASQPLWVLLLHLRREPWCYGISASRSDFLRLTSWALPLSLTLYSSRASFQESTSAESSQISSCELFLFDGAIVWWRRFDVFGQDRPKQVSELSTSSMSCAKWGNI